MRFKIDQQRLIDLTEEFVNTPSPVGYYQETAQLIEEKAHALGYEVEWDNKRTPYIKVEGQDTSKTVMLGAHLDTIGLIVRGFNADGTLRVRQLGGINYHSIEGVRCTILCRGGEHVDGVVICNSHSMHVFADAADLERNEDNMAVSIIGDVSCPEDARKLGISEGAIIHINPGFTAYDNGYILSRHIDDKSCVASLFVVLEYLKEHNIKPQFNTWFSFPIYEEIGHGGAYVPEEVSEFVALDITLIGPDYNSDEHQVGIINADGRGPYDWELSNQLQLMAEGLGLNYNTQVAFHFSTDAMAAYTKGCNLKAATFGPACLCTHGQERCHVDALINTTQLALGYVLGVEA